MAMRIKVNYDIEIKELAEQLGIVGYEKVTLGHGIKAYIKSGDEFVRVVVVNTKIAAIDGNVPAFVLDFNKKFFLCKDEQHIVNTIERAVTRGTGEMSFKMESAVDALMTIGCNALEYGAMCGHTFNIEGDLEAESMICIQKTPLKTKRVTLLVCGVYPITKKELDTLENVSVEDRFLISSVDDLRDGLENRKFGFNIEGTCNFNHAVGLNKTFEDAMKHSEEITKQAVKELELTGIHRDNNGAVHIETVEQFEQFVDIIKKLDS